MDITSKLLKVAGKEDFKLDGKINFGYIVCLCWKYGWMLVRGKVHTVGYKNLSSTIFWGRHVQVREKRYLSIGSRTKIHDNVKIDALSTDGLKIGKNCVIGRESIIECTGGLSKLGKGLTIGDRTTFGNNCFFGAAGGITIGNDVIAGQYVRFHSENHLYDDLSILIKEQGVTRKGIKIGDNCWIGSGATFLDDTELGDGCVVGANAVVKGKFPKNVVIGGVPAKILKVRGK